ncbi:hypothetical protein C0993_007075, partial [Termitomyces sp. T159_Od127]
MHLFKVYVAVNKDVKEEKTQSALYSKKKEKKGNAKLKKEESGTGTHYSATDEEAK